MRNPFRTKPSPESSSEPAHADADALPPLPAVGPDDRVISLGDVARALSCPKGIVTLGLQNGRLDLPQYQDGSGRVCFLRSELDELLALLDL